MPTVVFKEWMPDQADLGNPGLIRAENVLPLDSGYGPFLPLDTALGTITQNSVVGAFAVNGSTKGSYYVYALGNLNYYEGGSGGLSFATRGSATASSNYERFAQYEDLVIAVGSGHEPKRHTIGSVSGFTTLATSGFAPEASAIGVVNQFVVLGDLVGTAGTTAYSNTLAWSSIDQPTNWPTPGSSTAIASQSGEQVMPLDLGAIQAIHGGDQRGVILQHKGVSRMTYVGPPAVFQFDLLDNTQGSHFPLGSVQVGQVVYFISARGFCRTDGVSVENIGAGVVDQFFWSTYSNSTFVSAGYCPVNGLVYFSYPTTATAVCDALLIFNPRTNRWTYARQTLQRLVTPAQGYGALPRKIMGYATAGSANEFGIFAATAGSAVLETGDTQFNEGGRALVDGIKPHVESSGTAPSMGVRIGVRNDLGTTPTYTTTANAHSRTGYANFRSAGVTDGKYHRAELNITGNFEKVTGFDAVVLPSGQV